MGKTSRITFFIRVIGQRWIQNVSTKENAPWNESEYPQVSLLLSLLQSHAKKIWKASKTNEHKKLHFLVSAFTWSMYTHSVHLIYTSHLILNIPFPGCSVLNEKVRNNRKSRERSGNTNYNSPRGTNGLDVNVKMETKGKNWDIIWTENWEDRLMKWMVVEANVGNTGDAKLLIQSRRCMMMWMGRPRWEGWEKKRWGEVKIRVLFVFFFPQMPPACR